MSDLIISVLFIQYCLSSMLKADIVQYLFRCIIYTEALVGV